MSLPDETAADSGFDLDSAVNEIGSDLGFSSTPDDDDDEPELPETDDESDDAAAPEGEQDDEEGNGARERHGDGLGKGADEMHLKMDSDRAVHSRAVPAIRVSETATVTRALSSSHGICYS